MRRMAPGWLGTVILLVVGALVTITGSTPTQGEEPPLPRFPYLIYFDDDVDLEVLEAWLPDMQIVEPYASFVLASLSEEEIAFLEFEDVLVKDMTAMGQVNLMGASFDPLVELPVLPPELTASATGDGWYLVQFVGPVKAAWRTALMLKTSAMEAVSATTYLAYLTDSARSEVVAMTKVRWVGPYHPGYRLPSGLTGSRFVIRFFPGEGTSGLPSLESIGLVVDEAESAGDRAVVDGSVAQIEDAVVLDEVRSASPYSAFGLAVENARAAVGADTLNDLGLIGRPSGGTTQIVALFDSGYYRDHEVFGESGKVVHVNDNGVVDSFGDLHETGHGTATASIVLGDAPENSQYLTYNNHDGLAVGCKLVIERVMKKELESVFGGSLADEFDDAYSNGARVSNISVGGVGADLTPQFDEEVWDNRDHIIVVAADNCGTSARTPNEPFTVHTLGGLALSKNSITVGSCIPQDPYHMAASSSYGPASPSFTESEASSPGRIKPDIVAPGEGVTTASMWDYPALPEPPFNPHKTRGSYYNQFFGTSMAAPQVSAGAALVREYFMEGHHPDGALTPSAALVKAVLLNGAREITGNMQQTAQDHPADRWPNSYQGWGLMDLDRSCYFAGDAWKTMVWDNPQVLETGDEWATQFNVGSGTTDVKVTLVWIDPPSEAYRIPGKDSWWMAVKNNLDLRVVDPKGKVRFWGNNFRGTNPGFSESNGEANDVDNVEGVHLVPHHSYNGNLPTGDYTVYVTARSIATPGTTFALVIGGESIGSPQGNQQTGNVAIMGDYKGRMEKVLARHGYAVRSYKSGTAGYQSLLNDFSTGTIDVAILNNVKHTPGTTDIQTNTLITTANALSSIRQRGVMFLGLNPISRSGVSALEQWTIWAGGPTSADPTPLQNSNLKNTTMQIAPLIPADPVFNWLPTLPAYPIIVASKNGRDIQTFGAYSGSVVGGNAPGQPGLAGMIGTKAPPQGIVAARHVVMGSFGSTARTNVRHWTTKPLPPFTLQMFVNAMEWSRGVGAPPVPYLARVGVVGDHDKNGDHQIESFLAGRGYTVSSYSASALGSVTSDINALNLDVLVINNVDNASAFDTMLAAADAADCGVVFLGTRDASTTGIGVLSDRTSDPQSYAEGKKEGSVQFKVLSSHPVLAGFTVGKKATVINGGKKDYAVFTLPPSSQYTAIADSRMKLAGDMVAVRDRSGSATRHVLLGPLGINAKTHIGHWTQSGKDLLVQAIEWARNGAP